MTDNPVFQFPPLFAGRMQNQLGSDFNDFLAAMADESPVAVRINPSKWKGEAALAKVPWCNTGYYLPQRPLFTADPLFHGGAYYVQEPSSMFLEQVVNALQLPERSVVLDMCAAPGGKTTHLLSLLKPGDLLVSNEVIRGRAAVLQENVRKWGYPAVLVTQNDPADFGKLPELFDLVVVDAPCSGEGLFRKDRAAVKEWSPGNTLLCATRQKRILAEAWKCLKPGGYLIYSTCTFNPAENEDNISWLKDTFDAESPEVPVDGNWNIEKIMSGSVTGYQFFPHKTRGEGFFISVAGKKADKSGKDKGNIFRMKDSVQKVKVPDEIKSWISADFDVSFLMMDNSLYAIPSLHHPLVLFLIRALHVAQPGIPITAGQEKRPVPHPAVVLSSIFNRQQFPVWELDLAGAVRFLRKEAVPVMTSEKGWAAVAYRGILLGWLKNLGNRTNNYYPGEWRIRMAVNPVPRPWHEGEGIK